MVIKVVTSGAALLAAGMAFAANFSPGILPASPLTVVSAPTPMPVAVSDAATQWVNCATEGQGCTVSGTALVRYGAGNTFVTKEVTGDFVCGNAMFGDPIVGVVKSCSYAAPPPVTDQWVNCAAEGQSCAVSGTTLVRYGAGNKFVTKEVTGGFVCGNALFGDPIVGVVKSCSYSVAPPTADQWIICASEGQTCILSGSAQVRYGALGAFATRQATDRIACTNAVFGDPIMGVVKSCAYRATGVAQNSPTSVEMPAIASNFDVNQYLVPSWGTGAIPASGAPDVVGAFRFICNPGQLLADDPIKYPGQPGRSHLHQFFGNTAANAQSTYASLRTTGESTCNNMLNRSSYWIPAMMNGRGKVVRPDYISIYYKRRPVNDPECLRMAAKGCRDLPRGLRYIFGYDMDKGEGGAFYFNCNGPTGVEGHYPDIVAAARMCPVGNQLGAILNAPDCWDGKNLDSADHRNHMAYPSYNNMGERKCPDTHPYLIPAFTLGAWYTTDADLDRSGTWSPSTITWRLSSDNMAGMAPQRPGTTLHADWFGAWDDGVMKMWNDNCVNKLLDCSGGDLGNGKQLRMFNGFSWNANPRLVDPPA